MYATASKIGVCGGTAKLTRLGRPIPLGIRVINSETPLATAMAVGVFWGHL